MTVHIAILDDYQYAAAAAADWSPLSPRADLSFFHDTVTDPLRLAARLEPFEVIGAMRERTRFPAEILERLPNLKLLVTTGMRNAAIDMEAARRLGITVCGTATPKHPTGELTFALILALARNLVVETNSMIDGGWQIGLGRDLRGSVLGVLGLGTLGTHVARLGQAFGMEVIAWSQNLTEERAAEVGVRRVEKDTLFDSSDFLTIHLLLSDRTRGLVGMRELERMRPDAFLINTSRAAIVNTTALYAALRERRIGGAALDVFDTEPLAVDDPIRKLPNVVLTPHIGYVTRETYRVGYGEMVSVVLSYLDGATRNVLNAES